MKSAIATLLLAASLAPASATDWVARPELSSLRFSGSSQGESFEGSFARFTPRIRFDPAAPAEARFDVTIELASADTRNAERDETLHGSDFFDVTGHPQARFVADGVVATGTGFEARGELELRGIRRPVTLAFAWTALTDGARLEGSATLDRTDFDVGGGDWADPDMIAHEVTVATTLVLAPAATP